MLFYWSKEKRARISNLWNKLTPTTEINSFQKEPIISVYILVHSQSKFAEIKSCNKKCIAHLLCSDNCDIYKSIQRVQRGKGYIKAFYADVSLGNIEI